MRNLCDLPASVGAYLVQVGFCMSQGRNAMFSQSIEFDVVYICQSLYAKSDFSMSFDKVA